MIVRIDLASVPPVVEVLEPEDFGALKAVISVPEHAWIDQELLRPAGGRPDSAQLEEKFAGMVGYAASRGWVDEGGRVRAHIEIITAETKNPEQES